MLVLTVSLSHQPRSGRTGPTKNVRTALNAVRTVRSVVPPVDNGRVRFLTGHQVLDAMTEAARSGKHVTAAVAYVGSDAADILALGSGDLIVVNGSVNAIKTGATSNAAIRQWYDAGAQVFSHDRIHAKVFVVSRTAYVGSANLSERARSGDSIEAAVATTDSTLVAAVRAFIHRLARQAEEVDDAWLERAAQIKIERPPPPWNGEPAFFPVRIRPVDRRYREPRVERR